MPRIDAPRTDHRAFSAELAAFEFLHCLGAASIPERMQSPPHAGLRVPGGSADRRATSAFHAFLRIGFQGKQPVESFAVEFIQIDPGTRAQGKSKINHFSLPIS
jgi:hypothetical protein